MDELLAILGRLQQLAVAGADTTDEFFELEYRRDVEASKVAGFLESRRDLTAAESSLLDDVNDIVSNIPTEDQAAVTQEVNDFARNLADNDVEGRAFAENIREGAEQTVSDADPDAPRGRTPPPPESSGRPPPRTATPPVVPSATPRVPPTPPVVPPTPPVAPVVPPVVPPQPASVFTPPPTAASPVVPPAAPPVVPPVAPQPASRTLEELRASIEARRAAQEAADIEVVRGQAQFDSDLAAGQTRGTAARDAENLRRGEQRRAVQREVGDPAELARAESDSRLRSEENRGSRRRRRIADRDIRTLAGASARATAARPLHQAAARLAERDAEFTASGASGRVIGNRERLERGQRRLAARQAAEEAERIATRNANRPINEERARVSRLSPAALAAEQRAASEEATRRGNIQREELAQKRFDEKYNRNEDGTIKKSNARGYVFRTTVEKRNMLATRARQAAETANNEAGTAAATARRAAAAAAEEAARPRTRAERLRREGSRLGRQLRQPRTIPLVGPALDAGGTVARAVGRGALRVPIVGRAAESVITSPTVNSAARFGGAVLRHPFTRVLGVGATAATGIISVIQQGGLTYDDLLSSEQRLDNPTSFGGTIIPAGENVVAIDPRSEGLYAALIALDFQELESAPRNLDDYLVLRGDPAQLAQLEEHFPVKELQATLYGGEKTKDGEILFVEQDIPHPDGGEITQLTNLHTQYGEDEGLLAYLGGSTLAEFFTRNITRLSPDLRFISNGVTLSTSEVQAFELREAQAEYDERVAAETADIAGIQNGLPASQNPNNPIALPDFTQQTTPAVQPPPVTGIPEIDQALADGTTGDPQLDAAIEQVLRGEARGPTGNPAGPQPIQRQGPTGSPAPGGAQLQQGPTGVPEIDQALAQLQGSEAGSTGIPELDQAITQLQNSEAGVTGIPKLDQALTGGQQTPQQSSQVPQGQQSPAPQQQAGENEQLVNRILEQFPGLQTPQLQDAQGGFQALIDTLSQPIEVGAFDQREGFQGPPDLQQEDVGALRRGSRVGSLVDAADPNLTTAQALLGLLQDYTQDPVADRRSAIAEEQRLFGNQQRTNELAEFARVQGLSLEANANRERSLGQAVDSQSRAIGTRNTNEISRVRDRNTNTSGIFFGGGELLQRAIDSDASGTDADRAFLQDQANDDRRFGQGEQELELRREDLAGDRADRALDRQRQARADEALALYRSQSITLEQLTIRLDAIANRPVAGPR